MIKRLVLAVVLILALSACRLTSAPAGPVSSPAPATEALRPAPTVTVTPTPIDSGDLAQFQDAMTADAQGDPASLPGLTRYYIDLSVDPATLDSGQSPALLGSERLLYTNTENVPLEAVYLRLFPNTPSYGGGMMVEEVTAGGRPVSTTLESEGSALRVPLEEPLPPGERVELALSFRAQVPPNLDYGYGVYSYNDSVLALADFYPLVPVYDAQGWHTEVASVLGDAVYSDAALYSLRLTAPEKMVVVTSGSTLERRENGDGTATWTAVGGPMRDFYLVMSPDFQRMSAQEGQTTVNSYYLPGSEAGGRRILAYAQDALGLYGQTFGPYPYKEFDVVQAPTNAGGIEYPGVVVISSWLYSQTGGFAEHAAVHEVAHQWWYGLVGSDQVNTPWLDEALTNYSVVLYWEKALGKEGAAEMVSKTYEAPYRAVVKAGRDRPVNGSTSSFDRDSYSTIVYLKGPLFFDALRRRVGDEVYTDIMHAYLQRYRYRVATPDDFLGVVEEVSGQPVDDLYQKWIMGKENP